MATTAPNAQVNDSLKLLPGESLQAYEARASAAQGVSNPLNNAPEKNTVTPLPTFSIPLAPVVPKVGSAAPVSNTAPTSQQPSVINNQNGAMTAQEIAQENTMPGSGIKAYNDRIANLIQSQADDLANQPLSSSSTPTRTSSTIESDFQKYLDSLGAPPAVPDTATQQTNAENQVGLPGIQSNLNTLNTQLTSLENDLQNRQAQEASKPGVVATIINGRMQMLSAQDSKALNDLKGQITSANTQLTQANTAVATIMRNNQTNYANAVEAYNSAYTKAYQIFTFEESQLDKEQASASANAKVIIDSFKGTSNKPSAEQQAQFSTLELQAGLPSGFIQAAVTAESTSGTKIDRWQEDGKGNLYAIGTNSDGSPTVLKVFKGIGPTTKTASSSNAPTSAQQSVITDFKKSLVDSANSTALDDGSMTREDLIRKLQAQYGGSGVNDINPDDISKKVYETYPDKSKAKKNIFGS